MEDRPETVCTSLAVHWLLPETPTLSWPFMRKVGPSSPMKRRRGLGVVKGTLHSSRRAPPLTLFRGQQSGSRGGFSGARVAGSRAGMRGQDAALCAYSHRVPDEIRRNSFVCHQQRIHLDPVFEEHCGHPHAQQGVPWLQHRRGGSLLEKRSEWTNNGIRMQSGLGAAARGDDCIRTRDHRSQRRPTNLRGYPT